MTAKRLLSDVELEASDVVANNAMNRERGLAGVNSYAKELGFDPLQMLGRGAWLDLCCGSGRALIQAARESDGSLQVTGVDLVGYFDEHEPPPGLTLVTASITTWQPERAFDLITCVHGLHYIGDKIGVLARALSWLSPDGFLAAHLDLDNIKIDGGSGGFKRWLGEHGVRYDPRRRLVTRRGPVQATVPFGYLGADDRAGPNHTHQPSVDSYYERVLDADRDARGVTGE